MAKIAELKITVMLDDERYKDMDERQLERLIEQYEECRDSIEEFARARISSGMAFPNSISVEVDG